MLFSAYNFLIYFLPATLIVFYAMRAIGARGASIYFLILASAVFYGAWRLEHLALLAGSIAANYLIGLFLSREDASALRKPVLILGVVANLSLIFWFKYLDFALSNVTAVTGADYTFRNLILPLGISFFTFQQIGYLVDCHTNRDAERKIRDYALFVSFFPQLIAGPIVHHKTTRPQFARLTRAPIDLGDLAYGLMIFAMGLAKKTLIADPIAREIDPLFAAAASGEALTSAMSAAATIGYTLQIYFDFSGYCDMAIGLGLMFGVRLPVNFNSPYKSKSIIEFWRRWHITLSNFLRDYVYIPFGGDARDKGRFQELFRLRNIFLTMLIGGIWHGAAWTFVVWGAIHATLITANHAARVWAPQLDAWRSPAAQAIKQAALLVAIAAAWVYFRADGLDAAHAVFAGFANPGAAAIDPFIVALMAVGGAIALFAPNALQVAGYNPDPDQPFGKGRLRATTMLKPTPLAAASTAVLLCAGLMVAWRPAVFIYFNF